MKLVFMAFSFLALMVTTSFAASTPRQIQEGVYNGFTTCDARVTKSDAGDLYVQFSRGNKNYPLCDAQLFILRFDAGQGTYIATYSPFSSIVVTAEMINDKQMLLSLGGDRYLFQFSH